MIKSIQERPKEISIDLSGPDGNAFVLMGYAKNLSKQLGFDSKKITEEMMVGDYENLIKVFDKYFGNVVTLYR